MADSKAIDTPSGTCTMPAHSFTFDGTTTTAPCPNALLIAPSDQSGGALHIHAPEGTNVNEASCTDDQFAMTAAGTFVEVSAVDRQMTGYTLLQAYYANAEVDIGHYNDDDTLTLSSASSNRFVELPYNATMMRWWRIHPLDSHTIAGEYSMDGVAWNQLGTVDTGSDNTMQTITVVLGASHYDGQTPDTTSGTAVIESWNVCP
jgi:hypothetical protein